VLRWSPEPHAPKVVSNKAMATRPSTRRMLLLSVVERDPPADY
jgi:hypothetical protein